MGILGTRFGFLSAARDRPRTLINPGYGWPLPQALQSSGYQRNTPITWYHQPPPETTGDWRSIRHLVAPISDCTWLRDRHYVWVMELVLVLVLGGGVGVSFNSGTATWRVRIVGSFASVKFLWLCLISGWRNAVNGRHLPFTCSTHQRNQRDFRCKHHADF